MKEEVAFLKKSSAKNFCKFPAIAIKPVMATKTAFLTVAFSTAIPSGQKFFAELFFKKATAYFL